MGNLDLGKTLAYVGGVLSLISSCVILIFVFGFGTFIGNFGAGIPDYFPIGIFNAIFIILFILMVGGGITTIVGVSRIGVIGPEKAGTVVIVGSVIGGINWISLIGGILIKQAYSTSGIFGGNQNRGPIPNQPFPQNTNLSDHKRYCKNCGTPISGNQRYCQSCGHEL